MPVALFPRRHSQSHYTPLSTHESQTPSTFFGAKPVLHAHCPRCDVLIRKTDGEGASFEVRQWWRSGVSTEEGSQVDGVNGDAPAEFETVRKVEALVGSDSLVLSHGSSPATSLPSGLDEHQEPGQGSDSQCSLSIPYPAISLHAIQRLHSSAIPLSHSQPSANYSTQQDTVRLTNQPLCAIYLHIDPSHHLRDLSNPDYDDDGDGIAGLELLIVPPALKPDLPEADGVADTQATAEDELPNQQMVNHIFHALSKCADLHPDPAADGEGEDEEDAIAGLGPTSGGFGGGMHGEGGWITSKNAHEFDGQFGDVEVVEGGVILGPGAGTRRPREEDEREAVNGDAAGGNSGEDGREADETKWRRTG